MIPATATMTYFRHDTAAFLRQQLASHTVDAIHLDQARQIVHRLYLALTGNDTVIDADGDRNLVEALWTLQALCTLATNDDSAPASVPGGAGGDG